MTKLTKTQVSILASYSSPFVLVFALFINIGLVTSGLSTAPFKLVFLSASFPLGFIVGRVIYMRRSHVEISFDEDSFQIHKGTKELVKDRWKNYKFVSIILDQYGRPDLRLYKSMDGDYQDLPISKTNAKPQELRDYVQESLLSGKKAKPASLQAVEAA